MNEARCERICDCDNCEKVTQEDHDAEINQLRWEIVELETNYKTLWDTHKILKADIARKTELLKSLR